MSPRFRIVSWNVNCQAACWSVLTEQGIDVALVQEAKRPPPSMVVETHPSVSGDWTTSGGRRNFCAAVVTLSSNVSFMPLPMKAIDDAVEGDIPVSSRRGTLAVAEVHAPGIEPIIVASVYGVWEGCLDSKEIWADASVHRLISDLSFLVRRPKGHRIIVAGDLNILNSYGEHGNGYAAARYRTIFDRMKAIGLSFVGPQAPNGREAVPRPEELPADSLDVPTYFTRGGSPSTATRQLDFVFASPDLHPLLTVRAMNGIDEWGPSDHCRVLIEVNG